MWILLVVFQFDAWASVMESADECRAFALINQQYWIGTGQVVKALCMKTWEI